MAYSKKKYLGILLCVCINVKTVLTLYSNPVLLGETRKEFLGTVSANGVTGKII